MLMPYSFRAARSDDLPLLRAWLRTPEVVRWWGDPDAEAAMLEEDLTEPGMVMRIVSFDAKPFAYAQDYAVHRWPQAHFAGLPSGARAIDSFIGEPEMIGRGHGSAYLRLLAARLRTVGLRVRRRACVRVASVCRGADASRRSPAISRSPHLITRSTLSRAGMRI